MTITAFDTFCGAGGLSTGLEQAGIKVVGAVDHDTDAIGTYALAHPTTRVWRGDVEIPPYEQYRGVDILAGGPPCQPYSVHGKQAGEGDPRDGFPAFFRILDRLKPRAVLIENVPNLLRQRWLDYLYAFLSALHRRGYETQHGGLDAACFGVPQRRERLFILAWKGNLEFWQYPWPERTHSEHPTVAGPLNLKPWVTVRKALATIRPIGPPNGASVYYAKAPILRPRLENSLIVNGKGRVLDPDRPSLTIAAETSGNGCHILDADDTLRRYHAELINAFVLDAPLPIRSGQVDGVRRLTYLECARLQTFPDGYPFHGSPSSVYRQIGNAVPPLLARAVGEAMKRALES